MENFAWLLIICVTLGVLGVTLGIVTFVLQSRKLRQAIREITRLQEKLDE